MAWSKEKEKAYQKEYREKNKSALNEKARLRAQTKNRKEYQKKYREANKEKRKAYDLANKEKISARAIERVKERNAAIVAAKEFTPEYYEKIKQQRHKSNTAYKKRNIEKVREWKRNNYHKHKDRINAKRRKK